MSFRGKLLCGAFTASALFIASDGVAATAVAADTTATTAQANGTSVTEVVVTARKRSENLQRVPVAVTAISGQQLAQQGIRTASDLQRTVPSLTILSVYSSTGTGMVVSIRGQLASDILLTLSQPVGLYEDNVNIPHPIGTNISLFDISRVEVLKGPQGTLYGRNTTGGAINFITNGADYRGYHGFLSGEVGNYSDIKAAGAINLPIIDNVLAVRLAFQKWYRQGYGSSALTGQHLGEDHNDDVFRASVRFDPTDRLSITGKVEYIQGRRTDHIYQTRWLVNPGVTDAEWRLEGSPGGVAPSAIVANENSAHDLFTNYEFAHNFEKLTGWHGVFDLNYKITDNINLRYIGGLHQFTDFHVFELGGMPVQSFGPGEALGQIQPPTCIPGGCPGNQGPFAENRPLKPDEESLNWTQEVNLSGDAFDNHLKWLGGAYYSDDSGNQNQTALVYPVLLTAIAAPALGPFDANFWSQHVGTRSWAVYTQNDVKFNDIFSVTLGGRFTHEDLSQNIGFYLHNLQVGLARPFFCQSGPNKGVPQAAETGCLAPASASFSGWSYLASLNMQLTPQTLLYLKTARGFRGGALQVRAPDQPAAKPEIATDYELGLKTDLFDHRVRFNMAVYQTDYSNKQETTIVTDPVTGAQFTPIGNAATAKIRGFEGELTAVPFQGLTLNGTMSYLDGKYLKYPGAIVSWQSATVDASGSRFYTLPPWQFSISGRYAHNLGPGEAALNLTYSWHAKIPTTILNADPNLPQFLQTEWRRSLGLLSGSLDYSLPEQGLTFSFFATNLSDVHYQVQGLTFASYGYTGITAEPRMFGFQIRKTFGGE